MPTAEKQDVMVQHMQCGHWEDDIQDDIQLLLGEMSASSCQAFSASTTDPLLAHRTFDT